MTTDVRPARPSRMPIR